MSATATAKVMKIVSRLAATATDPQQLFYADLGLTDIDVLELVMDVEREFSLRVPDSMLPKFARGQDVIDYVTGQS